MAQHTPLTTGLVGVTATGAGALITWLVGTTWHGGIPEAAAGFVGSMLLMLIHFAFAKAGVEGTDATPPGK